MTEMDMKHEMSSGSMNEEPGKMVMPDDSGQESESGGMPMGGMDSTAEGDMPMGDEGGSDDMPVGDEGGSDDMPAGDGEDADSGGDAPKEETEDGLQQVLVEMRMSTSEATPTALAMTQGLSGFEVDNEYDPIPITPPAAEAEALQAAGEQTVIVRGKIAVDKIAELEAQPNIVKVWKDFSVEPFTETLQAEPQALVSPMDAFGTCPIAPCDCKSWIAKGTIADVANYLGVDEIWDAGYRGDGIVVGVLDSGITAQGRPISSTDTNHPDWPGKLIPRVIGGWPTSNWGTTSVSWGWHGNMCATDVLGMAPNAQLYDIRISGFSTTMTISNALAGFQWAINQHKANGTPQILSNSWGVFREELAEEYVKNPNHPFTLKVVEAINEGIIVLFAAGNCGDTCPDGRCSSATTGANDIGPGRSIWGANGHPQVITVGAVNKNEQFVGYSSQGPAALDPKKPDFCSITHFTGFFDSDSGTSAATPIAAGVIALFKQAVPDLTLNQAKSALKDTAKDIGPAGWDQHSGAGIIQAKKAFAKITGSPKPSGPAVSWGSNRLDAFVLGTNSALYHKWWNGSAWGPSVTGYEHMGGTIISDPEVVSWGSNRLDVFVLGTNSGLYHKWWNGSAWGPSVTGYEYMGGTIIGRPKAVAWGPNRLDVFVLGTNSGLYHKWWNGSAWGPSLTGYEYMGGTIISDPEVVSWGSNRLDVFVLGTNSSLYHKWWNGSAWGPSVTGYEYMGGTIIGRPKAVAWGPNRLDVFVIGTNSALYHKWWNGSAWGPSVTGYEYMGGRIISNPEVVSWGPNRLDVFVIGTDSALYHKWWNGSAWGPSVTGWENLGGRIIGQPRAVSWGPNRLDIFALGTNSRLYHKWWDGSSWGPSLTGWEDMGGTIIRF